MSLLCVVVFSLFCVLPFAVVSEVLGSVVVVVVVVNFVLAVILAVFVMVEVLCRNFPWFGMLVVRVCSTYAHVLIVFAVVACYSWCISSRDIGSRRLVADFVFVSSYVVICVVFVFLRFLLN